MTALRPAFPAERIAREIITAPEDIVFISGSLVEGFGNENSDLDIFLVHAAGEATPNPLLILSGVAVEGAYVDYEAYNLANMAWVAALINGVDLTDFRAVWEIVLDRIDLYYRTAIAGATYNPEGLRRLQRDFDRDRAAQVLAAWTGLRSAASLDQAQRSLAARSERQALVQAQAAAAYAADSYLATEGEAYTNLKWRYEKIDRRFGRESALYKRLWALKSPGTRDAAAYLDEVASFCGDLGMDAYAGWSADSLLYSRAAEVELFTITRRSYLVQNRAQIYELNPLAASVWRALKGRMTRKQLAEYVAKRWKLTSDAAAREVDGLLRSWRRYRLVRES